MSMKIIFVTGLLAAACMSQPTEHAKEEEFTAKHLARGNNKFAFDLYNSVKKDDNIFISPLSITSALGLLYMMSNGRTADQLTQVMHFNQSEYAKVTAAYRQALQSQDKSALSAANGVFVGEGIPVKTSYVEAVKEYMNATTETLDFGKGVEQSRQHINGWVAEKTHQNIKELLPESFSTSVSPHAMILCSAVHFKNDWIKPFPKTMKANFHSLDGTVQEIDMMYSSDTHFGYKFFPELGATVLRIDYKDKVQSMLVILPMGKTTFEEVETRLSGMDLVEDILDKMAGAKELVVQVTMPKFKFEDSYELKETLKKMGLNDVFSSSEADFTRATDAKNLEVNQIYHKAAVQVDEKGTVASAATAVDVVVRVSPIFRADNPFVFAIIDRASSSVAFLGRFVKPPK